MKKTLAILLSILLMLSLAFPAIAEDVTTDTYTLTINNAADGHTYEAYQIFTGDLSGNADNDAAAGTNAVLANIQWGANTRGTGFVSDDFLDGLTVETAIAYVDFSTAPVGTSTDMGNTYVIDGLVAGYYLIKDMDSSLNGKDDSYTEFLLEVVEDSTVSPKSSMTKVEKKVDDKNDSNTTEDEVVWNDSADYDIGDAVPFLLKATLADNVEAYDTYKIVFHDKLSAGLTYNGDAKVFFDEADVTDDFAITENEGALTISCADVTAFGATNNSVITVEYTANLNENAVLGSVGNPNEVYLEYSNNPNWVSGTGEGEDDAPTGKTTEDKVTVFTYKVVVNKVNESEQALPGAGFTLYKKNAAGAYVVIGEELTGDDMTTFEWKGLDDGDYKLVETTTPAGYNTIPDAEFTITAEHELESDDPTLESLEGGDMFTGEVSTGALTGDVINRAGATLPETGGMGTTIFYIVGGLMVVGAVILLVTKKRMGSEG